jgi:hypothetical protein
MFTIDSSVLILLYYLKTQIRNTKNKLNPSCGDPWVKQNESQVVRPGFFDLTFSYL